MVCQAGVWWPYLTAPDTTPSTATAGSIIFVQATPRSVDSRTVEPATQSDLTSTPDRAFVDEQPLVARVNQQPLMLAQYQQRLAQFEAVNSEAGSQAEARQAILTAMIDELIVAQYAATHGITVTQQEIDTALVSESASQLEAWLAENKLPYQQFIEQLRQQWVANQAFELITREVPQASTQIQVAYLILDDEAAVQFSDVPGNPDVLFEALSQESLVDLTSPLANGAPVWLPKDSGLLPAEVEEIAFSMRPGQISKPVQTLSGFYVVKVLAAEPLRPLTANMLQTAKMEAFLKWLEEQRLIADIEVYIVP